MFFPGQNPVGRTLTVGHWGAARIVGVVRPLSHWDWTIPGPIYGVKTIDDVVLESMASRNLPIFLLSAFAARVAAVVDRICDHGSDS